MERWESGGGDGWECENGKWEWNEGKNKVIKMIKWKNNNKVEKMENERKKRKKIRIT